MSSPITKHTLAHLAALARIRLAPHEEEKLLKDLEKILGHIAELESLPTENVPPMTGGTPFRNVFREDVSGEHKNSRKGKSAFPEEKEGFLAIPPVFE